MRVLRRLIGCSCSLLVVSCQSMWGGGGSGWKAAVAAQTAQLGHRNWIVISEASFPAHNRTGVRQIPSYQEAPVVLDEVLKILEQTEHVRPRIYVCRELRDVPNEFAPGVDLFREQLQEALHGHETTELEQDALMVLLQDATRSFDVLVVRTTTALPYTSVFLELQTGYWDRESERELRERMRRSRMEKLARPFP